MKKPFLALLALFASPAMAYEDDHLLIGAGYFDFLDDTYSQPAGRIELRGRQFGWGFSAMGGVDGDFDGGFYGYAGLLWDGDLGAGFHIIPNFAVGGYNTGGSKKLGGTIEFKSTLELDYAFPNDMRVGAAISHISNASIYNHNPGAESLMLTYSVPFGKLF